MLIQELRVASQRRRALEMELAREMQREQEQRRQRQRDARVPYQQAITALQRQRAEIARQIEVDRARDRVVRRGAATTAQHVIAASNTRNERSEGNQQEEQQAQTQEPETPPPRRPKHVLYRDSSTQMSPMVPSPLPQSSHRSQQHVAVGRDSRFVIEGIVALEPVQESATQNQPHRPIATTAPSAASGATHTQLLELPELVRRPRETHHDALNDVFSIQLQFAETMRKLEQSVQVREQLLQRSRSTSGKTRLATDGEHHRHRRRERRSQQLQPLDSDSESVSDGGSTNNDDDDGSLSSDASLLDYRRRLELRYRADDDCGRPSGTTTTTTASQHSSAAQTQLHHSPESAVPVEARDDVIAAERSPSSSHDPHTPSTESSDKTTASAVEKTVRFHGALATPVIAKKLFANASDESDLESDLESALSFLNGSSVTSAELNDVSLVKAFEAFRRELGMFKGASKVSSSPPKPHAATAPTPPATTSSLSAAISAARALFPTADDDDDESKSERDDGTHKPRKHQATVSAAKANDTIASTQSPIVVARVELQPSAHEQAVPAAIDAMDRQALEERRQQLCLDLQAESAQLVLTFGSRNAHEIARIKQHLIDLRSELRQVDEQLAAAVV